MGDFHRMAYEQAHEEQKQKQKQYWAGVIGVAVIFFVGLIVTLLMAGCGSGGGGGEATPAVIAELTVFPSSHTLTIDQTKQYTVVVKDSHGNIRDGLDVGWTTGDATIASINADGLLTARREGNTIVRADYGALQSQFVTVTVTRASIPQPPPAPARTSLPPWLTYCDNPSCAKLLPAIAAVCPEGIVCSPTRTTKIIPQVDGFPVSGMLLHIIPTQPIVTHWIGGTADTLGASTLVAYSASSIQIKSDLDVRLSVYRIQPVWGGIVPINFVSTELEASTLDIIFYRHPSYVPSLTELHAKAQEIIRIEREMTGRTAPKTTAHFIPVELANATTGEGHFSFGNGTVTVNYGSPDQVAGTGGLTGAPLARFSHEYAHELFAANLRNFFPDNFACLNEGIADATGFMSGFLPVEDFGPHGVHGLNFEDGCQDQTAIHDIGNCSLWHVKKAGKLTPAFIRGLFHPLHRFVFDSCTLNRNAGDHLWVYYQESAGGVDMRPILDAAHIPHSATFQEALTTVGVR